MPINLFITKNDVAQMWVNKHGVVGVALEDGSEINMELRIFEKLLDLYNTEMKETIKLE